MTTEQLENRLNLLEGMMSLADPKDLPALNITYQKLMDRLVILDLEGVTDESELPNNRPGPSANAPRRGKRHR